MKAIICTRYGPPEVLQIREVVKPAPKEDEVLIRVRASSINSRDWRIMHANPFLLRFAEGFAHPKTDILGADAAGRVEAVGAQVTQFKPGDEVFGCLDAYSGRAFAEYVIAKETELALKPANCTFEEAAAVPVAALTALIGLRDKGKIQAGQKVLIQGASGGVGTFALQIAKAFGAEVTAVVSTRNLDMAHALGADHVIDYKKEDFTRRAERYDLILAANGYHPIGHYLRVLEPEGTYVVAGGSMLHWLQAATRMTKDAQAKGKKIHGVSVVMNQDNMTLLKNLLETGKIRPVIDACYPMEKVVEAFQQYEKVHAKGKIVITMGV